MPSNTRSSNATAVPSVLRSTTPLALLLTLPAAQLRRGDSDAARGRGGDAAVDGRRRGRRAGQPAVAAAAGRVGGDQGVALQVDQLHQGIPEEMVRQ